MRCQNGTHFFALDLIQLVRIKAWRILRDIDQDRGGSEQFDRAKIAGIVESSHNHFVACANLGGSQGDLQSCCPAAAEPRQRRLGRCATTGSRAPSRRPSDIVPTDPI